MSLMRASVPEDFYGVICSEELVRGLLHFGEPVVCLTVLGANKRAFSMLRSLVKRNFLVRSSSLKRVMTIHESRWFLSCLSRALGLEIDIDKTELFIDAARSVFDENLFRKAEGSIHDIRAVMEIYRVAHGLFVALRPTIMARFRNVNPQYAFEVLGMKVIEVSSRYNELEIALNSGNLAEFLTIALIRDQGMLLKVQENAILSNPYPNRSGFFGGSILGALFNTAATRKSHFVDVMCGASRNELMEGDFNLGFERMKLCPELHAWFVAAASTGKDSSRWFHDALQRRYLVDNICTEYLARCDNDYILLERLHSYSGEFYGISDIRDSSIPFLLAHDLSLGRYAAFAEMENMKMFSLSDSDRKRDCMFAAVYFVFFEIVTGIIQKEWKNISNLHYFIGLVDDERLRNGIAVDLFSLIFLRNEKGQCICPAVSALDVISLILMFVTDESVIKILRTALIRIEFVMILGGETDITIDRAFASYQNLMGMAIHQREWRAVEKLCEFQSDLAVKARIGLVVTKCAESGFTELNMDGLNDEERERAALEIRLFCPGMSDVQDVDIDKCGNDAVASLIRARPRPRSAFLSEKMCKNLNARMTNPLAVEWKTGLLAKHMNGLLKRFVAYVDVIVPIGLNHGLGESVCDMMDVHIQSIIQMLLERGLVDQATEIAKIGQFDIIEEMLICQRDSGTELPLLRRFPVVVVTEMIMHPDKGFNLPTGVIIQSPVLDRLRTRDVQSFETGARDVENELRVLIVKKPLDIEMVYEMSFQVDVAWFGRLILDNIEAIGVTEAHSLVQRCAIGATTMESIITLRDASLLGIKIFNYVDAFAEIVGHCNYELAERFCVFLNDNQIVSALNQACVRLLGDSVACDKIVRVCPRLKNRVIATLPKNLRTAVLESDPLFFSSLPPRWTRADTPAKTIVANIDDMENVILLMTKFPGVDADKLLEEIVNSATSRAHIQKRVDKLFSYVRLFMPVFRNRSSLIRISCDQLVKLVSTCDESLADCEVAVGSLIRKVATASRRLQCLLATLDADTGLVDCVNSLVAKLTIVSELVSSIPGLRFGVRYSVKGVTPIATGLSMARFCLSIDAVDMATGIITAWDLGSYGLLDEYALTCFQLEQYNAAMKFAGKQDSKSRVVERFIDCGLHSPFCDMSLNSELCYLPHPIKVDLFCREFTQHDQQSISDVVNLRTMMRSIGGKMMKRSTMSYGPVPRFYERIDLQIRNVVPNVPTRERIHGLDIYMKGKASIQDRLANLVLRRDLDKVFHILVKCTDTAQRNDLFFGVIVDAIKCNVLSELKDKIVSVDSDLAMFGSVMNEKLEEMDKKRLFRLKYIMFGILQKTGMAIQESVRIFHDAETAKSRLQCLECVDTAIKMDLKRRERGYDSEIPLSTVEEYRRRVPLQLLFCRMAVDKKLRDRANLTLLHTQDAAEAMVVYLLKENMFTLAISIINECSVEEKGVAAKISDLIVNMTEDETIRLIRSLETHAERMVYERIVNHLLLRVHYVHCNDRIMQLILKKGVSEPDFLCRLLIQFDDVNEAFVVARQHNLVDLFPMIGFHISDEKKAAELLRVLQEKRKRRWG